MRAIAIILLSALFISCEMKGPKDQLDRPLNISSGPSAQDEVLTQPVDTLAEYFSARNTSLCEIYKILGKHEDQSFKAAAAKYPDNYEKQSEYQIKIYKEKRDQEFRKYNIDPAMSTKISARGFFDCPSLD